jgi:hypothetical protein
MEASSVCLPCCIRFVRVLAVFYPICPCACRVVSDMSVSLPCCIWSVSVLAVSYLICQCACRVVSDLYVCLPCRILFVRLLAVLCPICPCDCHVVSDLFTLISWTTVYNMHVYLTPNAFDWTITCKDYWRCCGLSYIFRQVGKIAKSDYQLRQICLSVYLSAWRSTDRVIKIK